KDAEDRSGLADAGTGDGVEPLGELGSRDAAPYRLEGVGGEVLFEEAQLLGEIAAADARDDPREDGRTDAEQGGNLRLAAVLRGQEIGRGDLVDVRRFFQSHRRSRAFGRTPAGQRYQLLREECKCLSADRIESRFSHLNERPLSWR